MSLQNFPQNLHLARCDHEGYRRSTEADSDVLGAIIGKVTMVTSCEISVSISNSATQASVRCANSQLKMSADTIFLGGDIVTMDENNPTAEALAVKDGLIIAIGQLGDILLLASDKTNMIDLGKKTLMPGLIEPHTHAVDMALFRCTFTDINGYDNPSYEKIKVKMQKTIAQAKPQSFCTFFGWDPELVSDLPTLSADFLNEEFSSEVSIFVLGQSGYIGWANHKALQAIRMYESDTVAVFTRDAEGNLTGRILGTHVTSIAYSASPPLQYQEICHAIKELWNDYASAGFTTITELFYSNMTDSSDEALTNQARKMDCPVRLALYLPARGKEDEENSNPDECLPNHLYENDKLWVQGYKIVADGSPHCGTMSVREPFLHNEFTDALGFPPPPDSYGHQYKNWDDIYELVKFYHDAEKQVAVHANGDRAIDKVISVFEKVLENDKNNTLRHRMEHVGLITEHQIELASKVHLTFSFFVAQLYLYGKSFCESTIGRERAKRWSPLSLATKHNVRWSLHQDHVYFPGSPRPFESIMTAVTRTTKGDDNVVFGQEYRTSVHEALKGYTINAAWQLNRDEELGSLEVNKKADLVILSDNPYKVEPLKLKDIKIVGTFIDGRSNSISS